jgi:hypothetical protein
MEQIRTRIAEALRETEQQMLGFLAEAAAQADYEGIDLARTVASKVRQLTKELQGGSISDDLGASVTMHSAANSEKRTRKPRTTAPPTKQRQQYPKFRVQSDCLLREGWSKKERRAYTHRVPREVFQAVVAAMQRVAETSNGAVTAEVILQEPRLHEASSVPQYQVYTVLGFLRSAEVVREVGRGRYQLPPDLKHQAMSLWDRRAATSAEL